MVDVDGVVNVVVDISDIGCLGGSSVDFASCSQ